MPAPIRFGRYLLLNRLAIGGMAEIFLAKATGEAGFERICVIKRVLPHLAKDPDFVRMFLDEARLAARLHHPGIVQIHELGREGNDYFIAMEYLAGEDAAALLLQSRKRRTPLPVEVAVKIIASAAEALHYAHEYADPRTGPLGIVHRDISPSNLFVTYQGAVKVLDFGVARAEGRLATTEAGTTKGKIAYMSPEQILGKPIDRRTDVWALGVCLHELLCGERLFGGGDGAMDKVRAVCESPIPLPSARRPGLPPQLDHLVMKALHRRVEQRYQTAEALRADLDAFLADRTYMPQSQLLRSCFRDLFGDAHVEAALALATITDPPESSGTMSIADAQNGAPTEHSATTRPERAVKRSVLRWWVPAAALIAAAASSYAWFAWPLEMIATDPPMAAAVATKPAVPSPGAAPAPTPAPAEVAAPNPEPKVRTSKRKVGRLTVESNVAVDVHLGKKLLGRTPLRDLALTEGRHRLRLSNAALGVSREISVVMEPGKATAHRANFGQGIVHIDAVPWAEVWLDQQKLGFTPLAGHKVWEGEHRVRLVGPNNERTLKVRVEPGQTVALREKL